MRKSITVFATGILFAASALIAEDKIVMDGSTTVGPIAKAFAEYYMSKNAGVNVTVSESGSGNGAKSLVNKACDIANMSRFMKDKEIGAAVEKGILPVPHVIAYDGLPVLVHPSNPVKALSLAQIRDIYSGKIANWKELGGPDMPIVVVSRDTNSGTYECFNEMVMAYTADGQKKTEKIAAKTEYVGSNGAVRQRVQSTTGAIGYAGLGFVDNTVKALEVDGVMPSRETVTSGKYPIARPLFMFTGGYPKLGSHIHSFVTLFLSKKGQEIIEEIGFVPVTNY